MTATFMTQFFYSQLFITPPAPTTSFAGQTIIVTGSNAGLGLEAAKHIARLHASKLILAVRNLSKGQAAKESILSSSGATADTIEVWELDMSSNASIIAFAERVSKLERLDAIIENAGVMNGEFIAVEGVEQVIQVNVLGTCLLALLLLPKLRETGEKFGTETKLCIVTSEMHHMWSLPEADVPGKGIYEVLNDKSRPYVSNDRYSASKALEVLFFRSLANTLPLSRDHNPIITLVNPGLCGTDFQQNLKVNAVLAFLGRSIKRMIGRTAEVGGRTLVAGITAGPELHGGYMADSVGQEVAGWVRSERGTGVQEKVYRETLEWLEGVKPGVGKNI